MSATHPARGAAPHATLAALTSACDTLAGCPDRQASVHLVLVLLLLKIASDSQAVTGHPATRALSPGDWALLSPGAQQLEVPIDARFERLHQQRFVAGNRHRLLTALQRLAAANPAALDGVLAPLRLDAALPPGQDRQDAALAHLLGRMAVPALDGRYLPGGHRRDIGTAADRLLDRAAASAGDASDRHVPDPLAQLMAALLDPGEDDAIYDPGSRSGVLLLACAQWARTHHGARRHVLYGQERDQVHWARARVRLLLHGEDNHGLGCGDPLEQPLAGDGGLQRVQVCLSRPAFSLPWNPAAAAADAHGRFGFGLPPRQRGHLAWIQHMLQSLDPQQGRMAIVVPHGVLFRSGEEAGIRRRLLDAHLLETVIGLPDRLFASQPVATALLVLRRNRDDTDVLFIDARAAPCRGRRGQKLPADLVARVIATCQQRVSLPGFSYRATPGELARHEGSLSIARYLTQVPDTAPTDAVALRDERRALSRTLAQIGRHIDADLRELAHDGQPATPARA
ncbi:class I SAM-dependent DNA methyltransferase [Stenotrophomonas sp. LGBM10]|uniref:class I SAM-dependent DNA methyltransferase n=1 Tax=Stenotrophomonas sp. LGBM10 TaxID=3390038 RepID=UPI00398AD035